MKSSLPLAVPERGAIHYPRFKRQAAQHDVDTDVVRGAGQDDASASRKSQGIVDSCGQLRKQRLSNPTLLARLDEHRNIGVGRRWDATLTFGGFPLARAAPA
jgi:hypothetical protein